MIRPNNFATRAVFARRRNLPSILERSSSSPSSSSFILVSMVQGFSTSSSYHNSRLPFFQVLQPRHLTSTSTITSRQSTVTSSSLPSINNPASSALAQFKSAVEDGGNPLYALKIWKEIQEDLLLSSSAELSKSSLNFHLLCRNLARLGKIQDKYWDEIVGFLSWMTDSTPFGWSSLHSWLDVSLKERDFERIIRLWDSFCDQRSKQKKKKRDHSENDLSKDVDQLVFFRTVISSYALMEPSPDFKWVLSKLLNQTWVTTERPSHKPRRYKEWSPFKAIPTNLGDKVIKWNDQVRFAQTTGNSMERLIKMGSSWKEDRNVTTLRSTWIQYRNACSLTSDTRWIERVVLNSRRPWEETSKDQNPVETSSSSSGLPDASIHIQVLGYFLNSFLIHGYSEEVAEVWSLAKDFGMDKDALHLWHDTLDAYMYQGDLDSLRRTLVEMKNKGIGPDARAFSYLIRTLLERGNRQEGILWLERVMNMPEVINPDPSSPVRHYSSFVTMIVNGLLALDLLPAVKLFLKRAIELNLAIGNKPFLAILRYHCHRPEGPNREAIVETMRQMENWNFKPGVDAFFIFIKASKTHQDKLFFLNAMKDYNLNPTPVQIVMAIIIPLMDSNQFSKAFEVTMLLLEWHRNDDHLRLLDNSTVSTVVRTLLSNYHGPEAVEWASALHEGVKKTKLKFEPLGILKILFKIGSPPAIKLAMDVFGTQLDRCSRIFFFSEFHDAKSAELVEWSWTVVIGGLLRNGYNKKAHKMAIVLEKSKFRPFTKQLKTLVDRAKLKGN